MQAKTNHDGPIEHALEMAVEKIAGLLDDRYFLSRRAIGLLLLQEDQEIKDLVKMNQPSVAEQIEKIIEEVKAHYAYPIEYEIALQRKEEVSDIVSKAVKVKEGKKGLGEWLSALMMNPFSGFPLLFLILYFGLYKFVGVFGAGTVVNYLEGTIYSNHLNPFLIKFFSAVIPWGILQDLIVGEYGLLTLGLRYAVALILPIVTFFLLCFQLLKIPAICRV